MSSQTSIKKGKLDFSFMISSNLVVLTIVGYVSPSLLFENGCKRKHAQLLSISQDSYLDVFP